MFEVVITGEALQRVRGLPLTFQNGLHAHKCQLVDTNTADITVRLPASLKKLQTGTDFVEFLGLV